MGNRAFRFFPFDVWTALPSVSARYIEMDSDPEYAYEHHRLNVS